MPRVANAPPNIAAVTALKEIRASVRLILLINKNDNTHIHDGMTSTPGTNSVNKTNYSETPTTKLYDNHDDDLTGQGPLNENAISQQPEKLIITEIQTLPKINIHQEDVNDEIDQMNELTMSKQINENASNEAPHTSSTGHPNIENSPPQDQEASNTDIEIEKKPLRFHQTTSECPKQTTPNTIFMM